MDKVEKWFKKYEMSHNKTKRQIYLATDDAKVLRLVRYGIVTAQLNLNMSWSLT